MVGSWRSAGCLGRILMLINYTLFFFPFSNLCKTTRPRKSQIKCFLCFQVAKYSSVFQGIIPLQFLLAWLFPGMLLGAFCLGFWREWVFCAASSETSYTPGSFPSKSQQGFSFELVHGDMFSSPKTSSDSYILMNTTFCINHLSLLLDFMLLLVLCSRVLSMGNCFRFQVWFSNWFYWKLFWKRAG